MSYTIKIVDINDSEVDLNLRRLLQVANKSTDILPEKFLSANLNSKASRASFFLAAVEHGKIIGCNGFLANDFVLNGVGYVGYQSCWSATDPHHQGKTVFTTIINEAKKILKEQGGGFLYGIANKRSNPIFTKKLGFEETDSLVLRIPNIPFYRNSYFTNKSQQIKNACIINEEQVKRHKALQYPNEVKEIWHNKSWLWGKLIYKSKYGIKLPVFYVGGVNLLKENDLRGLILEVFKQHPVLFIQVLSCKTNSFNELLKGWKRSKMNGFIFYNLNMPEPEHLNLMIGVLDVF